MSRPAFTLTALVLLTALPSFADAEVHVPEPMRFDLVRGLGAAQGELEMNVLSSLAFSSRQLDWSPELEWTPLRGLAVELELPVVAGGIEAIKPSVQVTLPGFHRPFLHGVQLTAAIGLDRHIRAHAVWVVAARLASHLAFVASVGPKLEWQPHAAPRPLALMNAALFAPLGPHAVGVEVNLARGRTWGERALVPQAHLSMTSHVHLQLGVGAVSRDEGAPWDMTGLLRFILER